jgi:hypothetical protein
MSDKLPIDLWLVHIKRSVFPSTFEDIDIWEYFQYKGNKADRCAIQEALIADHLVVESWYIVTLDRNGNTIHQRSDKLGLVKMPWGKFADTALVHLLTDIRQSMMHNYSFIKRLYEDVNISNKSICEILGMDMDIVNNTPERIVDQWATIISELRPRNIYDLKKLAYVEWAKDFLSSRLKLDLKHTQDLVKELNGVDENNVEDGIEMREQYPCNKKSKKKKFDAYEELFSQLNESAREAGLREFVEETWYNIDSAQLEEFAVLHEVKRTSAGNIYIKKRIIYLYRWELGVQGVVKHSPSEKKQELRLVKNYNIRDINQYIAKSLTHKVSEPTRWQSLILRPDNRKKKIWALIISAIWYRAVWDYINQYLKKSV